MSWHQLGGAIICHLHCDQEFFLWNGAVPCFVWTGAVRGPCINRLRCKDSSSCTEMGSVRYSAGFVWDVSKMFFSGLCVCELVEMEGVAPSNLQWEASKWILEALQTFKTETVSFTFVALESDWRNVNWEHVHTFQLLFCTYVTCLIPDTWFYCMLLSVLSSYI